MPRNWDEARLPSQTRQRKPQPDSEDTYAGMAESKNWILVLGTLWRVQLVKTALVCLQFLVLPIHLLIRSRRMTWMPSFSFLEPTPIAPPCRLGTIGG